MWTIARNGNSGIRRRGCALVLCAVTACAPIPRNHGYVPPPEDLARLSVGQDTRETVAEKVGAPLNQGLDRDDAWYYVSTRRQQLGLREQEILSREIVAIRFAESGRVENIERFGLEDGHVITVSARVTNPAVSEAGFLRRIFGNLGGPTADQFLETQ